MAHLVSAFDSGQANLVVATLSTSGFPVNQICADRQNQNIGS
jgi:hypothetical protein